MSKVLGWIGVVTTAVAVTAMVLPTWRMEWVGDDPSTSLYTTESWANPLLLGYGQVLPAAALIAGVVALFFAATSAVRGSGSLAGAILAIVGVACSLAGGFLFGGLSGGAIVAPVGLALTFASLVGARVIASRS